MAERAQGMRATASTLVVDAAVLVAAARGRSSGALLEAGRSAALVTTDRVVHEARRRIELGLRRPELLAMMTVVPVAALTPVLADSEIALRDAVAAGMGRSALARCVEADVWTTDRDFAGTGVASWSPPNLMRGLARAAREHA